MMIGSTLVIESAYPNEFADGPDSQRVAAKESDKNLWTQG